MPQVLPCSLCKRYATPPHVRLPRRARYMGEGVGGGARGYPYTTRQEALPRRGRLAAGADDSHG